MWIYLALTISILFLTTSLILNIKLYRKQARITGRKAFYKSEFRRVEFELQKHKAEFITKDKDKLIGSGNTEMPRESEDSQNDKFLEGEHGTPKEHVWYFDQSQKEEREEKKNIFFQSPIADSQFLSNDASAEHKLRFLYRVELNADKSSGVLHLEPKHPSDLELIRNFPESILENACTYQNSFYVGFSDVIQVASGVVIREGDSWRITEKVKIKFV